MIIIFIKARNLKVIRTFKGLFFSVFEVTLNYDFQEML